MKNWKKLIIIILAVVALIGATIGFFVIRKHSQYLSKKEALNIAINDANIGESTIIDADIDFENSYNSAWYDVEIETFTGEYEYVIEAVSGEILSKKVVD